MTVIVLPPMLTSEPTGLRSSPSSVAVSGPSTTTDAASATSLAVKNRPLDSVRARTAGQSVVVPTTDVVQFVVPYVSDCELEMTGATALMSGATTDEDRAVASAIVSVVADPKPPRTPRGRRRAPRRDDQQVAAQCRDPVAHLDLRALPESDGEDHGGDADEDAEHRQHRPQPMRAHGLEARTHRLDASS